MAPFSASTAAFFSTPEKNDFTIIDFYNIVADSRAVSVLDDNVVIINIDNSDRNDIADILQVVSLTAPKAVGLDVMFSEKRDDDSILYNALRACDKIIMPLSVRPEDNPELFRINSHSYFYPVTGIDSLNLEIEYAAASIPSKFEGGMVREMQVSFPTAEGDTILSFPAAIIRAVDPKSYDALLARNNHLENINFHSRRFTIIEPENLIDNADKLNDRIVLIGAIHEAADYHPTPVNAAMPGVMIHAYSIATVLDKAFMDTIPKWANILIGFILCFMVVYIHVNFSSKALGLFLRLLQIALLWVTVQLGYWLFVNKNLIIDFSYALLMLAFGLFACDIWNGSVTIFKHYREKYKSYKIRKSIVG